MKKTGFCLFLLAAYAVAQLWAHVQGPYWIVREQSPGYTYLLNALHLLNQGDLRSVMYHPGVVLTTMGVGIVRIFSGSMDATTRVLADPELILAFWQKLLSGFFVVALAFAGHRFYRRHGNGPALWVFLGTPFLFPSLVQSLGRISCEPLLAGMAFVGIGLVLEGGTSVIALALLGALGLATKLTFLPLVLFFFLMLRDRPSRVRFLAVLGLTYGSLMLALGQDAVDCGRFIVQAIFGQDSALPSEIHESAGRVVPYFTRVLKTNPFFLALPFFIGADRISRASITALVLATVMLALKPSEIYYIVPYVTLVTLAISLRVGQLAEAKTKIPRVAPLALATLALAVFVSDYMQYRNDTKTRTTLARTAANVSGEGPVVYCNFSSSPVFALLKANYTVNEFTSELSRLYPGAIFCDPLTGKLATWDRLITAEDITAVALHVLAPSGVERKLAAVFPHRNIQATAVGEIESLYRVW